MRDAPCLASQFITRLTELIAEHGDLPILACDADTEWRMPVGLVYRPPNHDWADARFEIRTEYHGEPKGYIAPDTGEAVGDA